MAERVFNRPLKPRSKWDTDKALQSTFAGRLAGRYQLRMFAVTCIIFSTAESWLTAFVHFNAIPPKSLVCFNVTNISGIRMPEGEDNATAGNRTEFVEHADWSQQGVLTPVQAFRDFNVSAKEPKNIHIEFGLLCGDERKILYSRIGYILSKHLGAIFCGHLADQVGRKITFVGASLICYAMLLFQILSEDFVSYCFFMVFIGLAAGGIIVSGITMVVETFPISSRSMFSMLLLTCPFLFDLIIPWLAKLIGWWKVLQTVCGLPLLLSILLHRWSEETVYFHVSFRQFTEAIYSLTKIALFNSIAFQSSYKEAREFLEAKHSKGVYCDFQPLIRLQDIPKLKEKYPTFNFADMVDPDTSVKQTNRLGFVRDIVDGLRGKHFSRNASRFKPGDYFQSGIVGLYLFLVCALWFVNGVTFSSLESHELSWRLKRNPYWGYCFRSLTAIIAAIVIFPLLYKLGRRWPTFCLYLVGEVCLLASIVAKIEREFTPVTLSLIYLLGKASTYGAYIVLAIFTTEIFPTGLRATSLGLGLLFRAVGVILADPDLLNFHDWTSRLIYGFLSLLIGSLALFLPEVKRYPLSRTFNQVEAIPSGISRRIRQMRVATKRRREMKIKQKPRRTVTDSQNEQPLLNEASADSLRFAQPSEDGGSELAPVSTALLMVASQGGGLASPTARQIMQRHSKSNASDSVSSEYGTCADTPQTEMSDENESSHYLEQGLGGKSKDGEAQNGETERGD